MLRIIEKACGFIAATCKNIVLFSLAAIVLLFAGAIQITLLNVELEAARNENAALSHRNAELIESVHSREQLIDEMRMELEAADEKQSLVIREELRFLGLIKLGSTCFSHDVSCEIFDGINLGDDVSTAPWLEASFASSLVSARFIVAAKVA